MRIVPMTMAMLLAFAADNLAVPAPRAEKETLQGIWELVEYDTGDGAKTDGPMIGRKWIFDKDQLTVQRPDVSTVTTFKIDETAKPKRIEWVARGSKVCKGIYLLDGDKLQICYGINETPDKLAAGAGISLFTYKRVQRAK